VSKIKIVTDSACDLPVSKLKELNVAYVPVCIIIDGKKYKQHVSITTDELYHQLIVEKKKIGTSAPAPGDIHAVFEKVFKKHDTLIFLSLHHNLSGTYQAVEMVAKEYFPDKDITIIDCQTASLAQAVLVEEASIMVRSGKSKEEIIERITYLTDFAVALPLLDTLEYLHRGGRIKLYQKLMGGIFGIKALVRVDRHGSTLDGRARGRKNALIHMKMCGLQIMDNLKVNRMFVGYTTNIAIAEDVAKFLKENNKHNVDIRIEQLGAAVGVHVGNDTVGYGFVGEYSPKMFSEFGEYSKSLAEEKKSLSSKG